MAKRCGFPPVYKVERVAKMSVKRAFLGIFQKLVVFCCAIFFGFANAFSANLPSGYTELEYIESTSTQYINTGFAPTANYKHTIVFETLSSDTGYLCGTGSAGGRSGNVKLTGNNILDIYNNASGTGAVGILGNVQLAQGKNTLVLDLRNASKSYVSLNGVNLETTNTNTYITSSRSVTLFGSGAASSLPLRIYESIIEQNGVVIAHFVPAKNSSGVIGMYDLVSGTFFTNAGSGTFTAGPEVLNPCRNLFDSSVFNTDVGDTITYTHYQIPNGTYTMSTNFPPQTGQVYTNVWVLAGNVTSGQDSATNGVSLGNPKTITVTDGWYSVVYRSSIPNIPRNPKDYNWQLEQGSTATAYVPYNASCHNTNSIKIATTAYNAAQFNPVVTDLNSTIATIRDIVTNTINQTAAIASLQADKQTRPEEACPAGKKCLLVETEENGVIVPHWYPIIESAD